MCRHDQLPTIPIDNTNPSQNYIFTSNGNTHRLQGAVYFSTVTNYYPKDKFCPSSLPTPPVKEFILQITSAGGNRGHNTTNIPWGNATIRFSCNEANIIRCIRISMGCIRLQAGGHHQVYDHRHRKQHHAFWQ